MRDQRPDYSGPDQEKHKPLDRKPTQLLIEKAIEIGEDEPLKEICVRVPLSTGLRNDELVHLIPENIGQTYSEDFESVEWYVSIPEFVECYGGSGPAGKHNKESYNLHKKGRPCTRCRRRSIEGKLGWMTEEAVRKHRERPGFSAKTKRSIEKYQWFLPGRDDLAEKLNHLCELHGQFPVSHSAVNRRIRSVAREAGLEDFRSKNENGKLNITAHALRHTYGCKIGADPNFNPNSIMSFMRHKSYDMALWYSDQWGERRRNTMAGFEDEFS